MRKSPCSSSSVLRTSSCVVVKPLHVAVKPAGTFDDDDRRVHVERVVEERQIAQQSPLTRSALLVSAEERGRPGLFPTMRRCRSPATGSPTKRPGTGWGRTRGSRRNHRRASSRYALGSATTAVHVTGRPMGVDTLARRGGDNALLAGSGSWQLHAQRATTPSRQCSRSHRRRCHACRPRAAPWPGPETSLVGQYCGTHTPWPWPTDRVRSPTVRASAVAAAGRQASAIEGRAHCFPRAFGVS